MITCIGWSIDDVSVSEQEVDRSDEFSSARGEQGRRTAWGPFRRKPRGFLRSSTSASTTINYNNKVSFVYSSLTIPVGSKVNILI